MGGQDRDARFGQQQLSVQTAPIERGTQDSDVSRAAADRGGGSAWMPEQDVHLGHPLILGTPLHDLLDQVRTRARLDRDGEAVGLGSCPAGPLNRSTGCLDGDPSLLE